MYVSLALNMNSVTYPQGPSEGNCVMTLERVP